MRFTEKQIFDAGAVHGYLIAKQNMVFAKMNDSEITRRIAESVLQDFSCSRPKEAAEYQEFLSQWKRPKRKSPKGGG